MTTSSPSDARAGSAATSRLRVAIVGAGMIGEVHRRSVILAGAELIGVLASTPARSAEVGGAWGVRGYDSIDDLLADSPDVVHICTPNATHAPFAEAALRAGAHVVCEKPLGMDVAEARGLADLAAETGLVATVPFVYRYHPLVREIRARREAGEFGDWNLLHGTYLQDWLLSPLSSSWRVDPTAGGASRAFADIGSHWCDLVEWVSGERFASLTARLSIAVAERPAPSGHAFSGAGDASVERVPVTTEDSAVVTLETETGVIGNVVISQLSAGRKNRLWFELDGSQGSAIFDQENPETVRVNTLDDSRLLFRDAGSGSAEQRRLSYLPAGHAQGYADCFDAFIADTYAVIHGGTPEGLPTFEDGARSALIVDAALRSGASRSWERIGAASSPHPEHGANTA